MLCPGTRDCDQVVPGPALLVQKSILCTHFSFTIVRPYEENKYRQSKRVSLTFFFSCYHLKQLMLLFFIVWLNFAKVNIVATSLMKQINLQ